MCHRADGQRAHAGGRFATWIRSTRVKFAVVGSSRAIPEEQLSIAAKTSNGAEMQMQHVYVAFVHVFNGKPGDVGREAYSRRLLVITRHRDCYLASAVGSSNVP